MASTVMMFDIFQHTKNLQKSGAKAQVEFFNDRAGNIKSAIDNDLVTKQDIKELDFKIEALKSELKVEIAQMSTKTITALSSILGSVIVVRIAVLGFLIQLH